MKAFSLIALVLLLCGCSTPRHDSSRDVKQFYLAWMSAYTQERDTSALMQRYVAKDVINRLALIDGLYEQEILDSDYFMYVQDYDPEWIPLLRVGPAQPFLDGEKVEVQLGGPTGAPPCCWKCIRVGKTGAGKFIAFAILAIIMNSPSTVPGILPVRKLGLRRSHRSTKR